MGDEPLLDGGGRRFPKSFPELKKKVVTKAKHAYDSFKHMVLHREPIEKDGDHWREWLTEPVIRWLPEEVKNKIDEYTAQFDEYNQQLQELEPGQPAPSPPAKTTMFHFAGPAIRAIMPVTYIQWPFAILFPFVVCWVSSCPQGSHPFAHYPTVVWVPFVTVVLYSMYREWVGLTWILYTLAGFLAPFKIFFGIRVRIQVWFLLMAGMSLVTHLDIATNGLFLAKIIKTMWYCERPTTLAIRNMWELVINESSVRDFPGFNRIDFILLISWSTMLFQPILGFLYAYPLNGVQATNYEVGVGRSDRKKGEMDGYKTPWVSCSKEKLHHADVLKMVAVVNRMVSMTDKSLQWALARAQWELDQRDNVVGWTRMYDILYREFNFNLMRLFLVNLLEKSWMLEAQTTIFAISRCLLPFDSSPRFDGQMLMSLALSFLTFMKVIYDAVDQMTMIHKLWNKATREHDHVSLYELFKPRPGGLACIGLEKPPELTEEGVKWKDLRRNKRKVLRIWLYFVIVFLVLLFFFVHCFAKTVMAFYCKYSLWNIPFSHKPHQDAWGCVDVSAYRIH